MTDSQLAPVLGYLRQLATEGPSDALLLERFIEHRDSGAFELLLRRHGPLVWRVCRRVLSRQQDAEDAFQATFLTLSRRARSIRKPESLASFLHGIAYRIARRTRQQDRHLSAPPADSPASVPDPGCQAACRELGRIVEEEVHALPEALRAALLLCYWEGLTNEEAAGRLGCPCGTLKTRLARARKLLHRCLTRRGVTVPVGLVALLLAPGDADSSVPPALEAAVRAARAAGTSSRVAALAAGGVRTMTPGRVLIGLVLLAVGTVAAGMGTLARRASVTAQKEGEQAQTRPAKEAVPARADRQGDPLPERALVRLGTVRWRMGGLFFACAYSPDGKTLAAASADHRVYLFDATTGRLMRRLRGHPAEVTSVAYAPDGHTLASGCVRGIIRLWEPATGKMLRQFRAPRGPVWSLIFTRDGKDLISGGHDSPIIVWDPATGKERRRFSGPKEGARTLALSPDGRMIASTGNGQVQIWEADTGKLLRRVGARKERIRALAFSPDSKLLAIGNHYRLIRLLDCSTGEVRRWLPEKRQAPKVPQPIYALAFAPDGKTLAAGCADHTLTLWEAATGRKLWELPGVGFVTCTAYHEGGIPCLAYSPGGKRLAFGQNNRLALLDSRSGEEALPVEGYRGAVQKVFFGPDGKQLLTVGDDPTRRILQWDATTGRLIRPVPGETSLANQVSFSQDRKVAASALFSSKVLFLDTETGKEIRRISLPRANDPTAPNEVVLSPDGKLVAVVEGLGKAAWLLDVTTGKQLWGGTSTRDWEFVLARFSGDGKLLAVVGNRALQFVALPSGRPLRRVSLPQGRTSFAADLSPDGRTLALASWPHEVRVVLPPGQGPAEAPGEIMPVRAITLWETATGKVRRTVSAPCRRVNCLLFSPDGRFLALGGDDRAVHLCELATGKWVGRLQGHRGEVKALAFSADGQRLASGSLDTTALVWDLSGLTTKKH